MHKISIGRLAKLANVSIDTIRFYEKSGLLAPHVRRPSGFREYSPLGLKQLRFIRRGRLLGFSLDEIRELLALQVGQESTMTETRQKLRVVQQKIHELERWRDCLTEFLAERATTGSAPHSVLDCFTDDAADSVAAKRAAKLRTEPQRDCNDHN